MGCETLPEPGILIQQDATPRSVSVDEIVVVTDPPYYDSIGYVGLSDFFYVWLGLLRQGVMPIRIGTGGGT